MCISVTAGYAAQLKNVAVSQQAGKTTIYLTINGPFTHKLFTLANPERVVLDLTGTTLGLNLNRLGLTNGVIKQVRSGVSGNQTLRLVLDVNQKVQARSTPWRPKGSFYGIRVDLMHANIKYVALNSKPKVIPQVKNIRPRADIPRKASCKTQACKAQSC